MSAPCPPTTWIDYESRSQADLPKVGAWAYAGHESTEVVMAVWFCEVSQVMNVWVPFLEFNTHLVPNEVMVPTREGEIRLVPVVVYTGLTIPQALQQDLLLPRVIAHNAEFEAAITEVTLRLTNGQAVKWGCTAAMAAYFQFPVGLDGCGEALNLGRKDVEGRGMMELICIPDASGALTEPLPFMVDGLIRYNIQDVVLTMRIDFHLGVHFPEQEARIWKHHLAINRRGILLDMPLVEAMRRINNKTLRQRMIEKVVPDLDYGDLQSLPVLKRWLASRGVKLGINAKGGETLDKKAIERMLERANRLPPDVVTVLKARQDSAKASLAKLDLMIRVAGPDGRIRGQHRHAKASTLRWAGWGIQVQNFPKPPKKTIKQKACIAAVRSEDVDAVLKAGEGSIGDALVTCMSGTMIAAPGKTFIISDYAQVEARGVLWLAEDYEHLEWWITKDMYSEMASRLFGRIILKGRDDKERDIGKRTVLGCNFQQAEERFEAECIMNGIDLKALGLTGSIVINGFRDLFTSLSDYTHGLWARLQEAMIVCIKEQCTVRACRLTFRWNRGNVYVRLPSGRDAIFRGCYVKKVLKRSKRTGRDYWTEAIFAVNPDGTIEDYYGGKLADNFVQAICRDLTANTLCECEEAGIPIIMHKHDEVVSEVLIEDAPRIMEKTNAIMRTGPEWAKGFPLDVESHITTRYDK